MPLINIALVVESRRVPPGEVKGVAAAVQRQLLRDFAPIWGMEATLDAFPSLEYVPQDAWPIIVRDDIPGLGVGGIHLDDRGQPYALVRLSRTWSLTVSHEALEMVADPWGNRLCPAISPIRDQGLVEVLVEVCDPVAATEHAYTIDGYLVSDFYTPQYFDRVSSPAVRYSFTGTLKAPLTLLRGGYLAWRHPVSNEWWQWNWTDRRMRAGRFVRLGRLTEDGRPLRERIDAFVSMPELYTGAPPNDPKVRAADAERQSARAAAQVRADSLQHRIGDLIRRAESFIPPLPELPNLPFPIEGPIPWDGPEPRRTDARRHTGEGPGPALS